MKELLEKVSPYNIFNYMFPGTVFVVLLKSTTKYDFSQPDLLAGAFSYYFIGMVISRVGSVFWEYLLKKVKFVKFKEYEMFIDAAKHDAKLDLMSEVNNTYRTLVSMTFILLIFNLYNIVDGMLLINKTVGFIIGLMAIMILFLLSYRKQTNYINKRIEKHVAAPSENKHI